MYTNIHTVNLTGIAAQHIDAWGVLLFDYVYTHIHTYTYEKYIHTYTYEVYIHTYAYEAYIHTYIHTHNLPSTAAQHIDA